MASTKDLVRFVVLSFLWGSGFVALKVGLSYFPPVLYAALCYNVTAVGMFGYLRFADGRVFPSDRRSWGAIGVVSVLMVILYNALLYTGQRETTSAIGAIILSLVPVLTIGFGRLLNSEDRFDLRSVGGVALGLVGVGIIVRPDPSALQQGVEGKLLIFLAANCTALGSVSVQRIDYGDSFPMLIGWSTLIGGLGLHVLSLTAFGESLASVRWTVDGLLALLYLAAGVYFLGYTIFFYLLDEFGAFETNLVSYASPMSAALVGWIVLGESLTFPTLVGFGVIVAGFAVLKQDAVRAYLAGLG